MKEEKTRERTGFSPGSVSLSLQVIQPVCLPHRFLFTPCFHSDFYWLFLTRAGRLCGLSCITFLMYSKDRQCHQQEYVGRKKRMQFSFSFRSLLREKSQSPSSFIVSSFFIISTAYFLLFPDPQGFLFFLYCSSSSLIFFSAADSLILIREKICSFQRLNHSNHPQVLNLLSSVVAAPVFLSLLFLHYLLLFLCKT